MSSCFSLLFTKRCVNSFNGMKSVQTVGYDSLIANSPPAHTQSFFFLVLVCSQERSPNG